MAREFPGKRKRSIEENSHSMRKEVAKTIPIQEGKETTRGIRSRRDAREVSTRGTGGQGKLQRTEIDIRRETAI
jgi:hypothetical protein